MMTFHEAVDYLNDKDHARRKFTPDKDEQAISALVQKICDLEAQVDRLLDRNPS